LLTSTIVLGMNYFVVITHPLHQFFIFFLIGNWKKYVICRSMRYVCLAGLFEEHFKNDLRLNEELLIKLVISLNKSFYLI